MARKQTKRNKSKHTPVIKSGVSILVAQIFKIVLIAVLAISAYVTWLDFRIYDEFEGRKWSVPARVFSRPAEVYKGQEILISDLTFRLKLSGYRQVPEIESPGEYSLSDNGLFIYLRSFKYWDGEFSENLYEIVFKNGAISQILNKNSGSDIAILRIEPVLIGKIYPDHNEDRVLVTLADVPDFLIQALTSVEDRNFYSHYGIDFKGILRAAWINLRSGEFNQGGSTITQQLIKNYFLTRERTLTRKINEIIMAFLLERRYSKDEILAGYLNEIYLGQDGSRAIHGFGTAAEFYFNKPLVELEKEQLALLVAMARGASYYNPRRWPERAQVRRNLVLDILVEQEYLDVTDAEILKLNGLGVTEKPVRPGRQYAAFLDLAKRQLLNEYDIRALKNDGLIIYSTLSPELQVNMENVVESRIRDLERHQNFPINTLETAFTVINPINGDILGLYGGRNYLYSGFNRAISARRPVGSLIKPFVYLAALSRSEQYGLLSMLSDESVSIPQDEDKLWMPENYDKIEHGNVSLIEAFVNSYNLATVRLGMEIGVNSVTSLLAQSGVVEAIHPYPSLLLGALELTPLQVTQLYQIIANGGYKVPLNSIQEVLDHNGEPLQRQQLNIEQIWDDKAVFLINYLMTQVVKRGTAKQLSAYLGKSINLAGKTGTSDGSRDSWFAGYGENYLAVAWIGKDDNTPTSLTGASGAMHLWADIAKLYEFNGVTLVEPTGINWQENISVRFRDDCLAFGNIPYIDVERTNSDILCQQVNNNRDSLFDNIRQWFQE